MRDIQLLLNEAEHDWREDVRRDFPLRSDTSVIRRPAQNGRDWTFSTDLKSIFAEIAQDNNLGQKFETIVAKYWDGNPEKLVCETLHYLLHHELYHPIEAPFSVEGENNDNKRIHQAIRRGVLQAEPKLSPLEQVVKVQASQNGVKDFILDNRFALDNKEEEYVREDIIPIWDLLELQDSSSETNFYTVTRLLYGVLYGPQSTHKFFKEKSGKKGVALAEKALSTLIGKSVKLPKTKGASLVDRAKLLFNRNTDKKEHERVQAYVKAIRDVFSGDDRYKGIERFMAILGPYVQKDMPQGRPDMQGAGSGASPQNILQDLLDDMSPQEQQQFVQELAQEEENELQQAASEMQLPQDAESSKPGSLDSSADEMKNLDVLATHEFYKRNHPKVHIIGGKKIGESVVVGKQKYWDLKRSTVLTEDQLSNVNLNRISILQKKTRLPWLMDLGNGTFRLNEYELKQRDIKDIEYVDSHIDVPDMVEFYLDSSGSMFKGTAGKYKANDGSRWDMLSHVMYGFVNALHQGGKQLGKQTKMRIHNFANSQISSDVISVNQFWSGETAPLNVLFKPKNGYSVEDVNLTNYRDGQQRTYVVVTDGDLVLNDRTEREARKMKEIAKNPNNHVVLFEIGGTYDLGKAVKSNPNIVYHPVHDKNKMLQAGLEVLLSKREEISHISGVSKIIRGDF
ncbi:MAG: hypothetical protein KKA65_03055 [Nanoarchaeota archaeon]|nr:hypothetical protein [Nanoarchaeota archaeon]MBU4352502.1 hypothetical protein [Nanoarchaeota archaeon]MBU4456456.1 hypothetical protein [Nanoarchaeota archaeon]MCG2720048.1 hypothetical protein [Nanoarchaeota archaeon]